MGWRASSLRLLEGARVKCSDLHLYGFSCVEKQTHLTAEDTEEGKLISLIGSIRLISLIRKSGVRSSFIRFFLW